MSRRERPATHTARDIEITVTDPETGDELEVPFTAVGVDVPAGSASHLTVGGDVQLTYTDPESGERAVATISADGVTTIPAGASDIVVTPMHSNSGEFTVEVENYEWLAAGDDRIPAGHDNAPANRDRMAAFFGIPKRYLFGAPEHDIGATVCAVGHRYALTVVACDEQTEVYTLADESKAWQQPFDVVHAWYPEDVKAYGWRGLLALSSRKGDSREAAPIADRRDYLDACAHLFDLASKLPGGSARANMFAAADELLNEAAMRWWVPCWCGGVPPTIFEDGSTEGRTVNCGDCNGTGRVSRITDDHRLRLVVALINAGLPAKRQERRRQPSRDEVRSRYPVARLPSMVVGILSRAYEIHVGPSLPETLDLTGMEPVRMRVLPSSTVQVAMFREHALVYDGLIMAHAEFVLPCPPGVTSFVVNSVDNEAVTVHLRVDHRERGPGAGITTGPDGQPAVSVWPR